MEQYIKFVFYAVLFLIYIVSQVRKMKNKTEEQRSLSPEAAKEIPAQPAVKTPQKAFDYKGKREIKKTFPQQALLKKEKGHRPLEYKPVADEALIAEANLIEKTIEERRKEEQRLREERKPLQDEHLKPYANQVKKGESTASWLQNKTNLKKAFIASEVFQRKY
ncbi:MAG TPA: hypothetical protein VK750_07710 [Cytophagaceae bacterium]|jgi:hypothetical protein|nr:hypothetical protein [Cytophagaceae bacterium]